LSASEIRVGRAGSSRRFRLGSRRPGFCCR
jgi:hypothetical protein